MMRFNLFDRFYKASEKIMLLLPDRITGSSDIMLQKYKKIYGSKDSSLQIKKNKIYNMEAYIIICILFTLTVLSLITGQFAEQKEINRIERPAYGEDENLVPVEVRMSYKNYEIVRDIAIKVKQSEATEEEKREILEIYSKNLENIILGNNEDLKKISGSLNLPDWDMNTGISIVWNSSSPDIINHKGEVDLINAENNNNIELQAIMTLDDISIIKTFNLIMDRDASEADYKQTLHNRLKDTVEQVSDRNKGRFLSLPKELDGGIEIGWFSGEKTDIKLPFLFLFIGILIVYYNRYDRVNRELKESEESIVRDLPEFINKLILLLNAGMVVSSAFKRIAADYELSLVVKDSSAHGKRRVIYKELCDIEKKANQTNLSPIRELQEFSQKSGVRDFIRMTALISDNWNKGSLLAEKLEGESNLLWLSRKKRAEEKGKIAETKLTFPLMILLIVLIMVTVAPALMEM